MKLNETVPVGTLVTKPRTRRSGIPSLVSGGYSNARAAYSSGERLAYRVNLKNRVFARDPGLESEAQMRYDAAKSGESFHYCNKPFNGSSDPQVAEICARRPFPRHAVRRLNVRARALTNGPGGVALLPIGRRKSNAANPAKLEMITNWRYTRFSSSAAISNCQTSPSP